MGFETQFLSRFACLNFYNKAVPMGFETSHDFFVKKMWEIIKQSLWDLKHSTYINNGRVINS